AVNQVEIDGTEPEFARPAEDTLGHFARLDAMDGFLHFGFEILDAQGSAVESNVAQRLNVLAGQAARIDFHAGFNVVGKSEIFTDDVAQPADFVGSQERGGSAAPMQLDDFAFGIHLGGHAGDFAFQVIHVGFALRVVERDDGGAAAEPAQGFAKRNMKIKR